jgi:hypothetical protein
MAKLKFLRNVGSFLKDETHEVENSLTQDYFVNNGFAIREIFVEDCGCDDKVDKPKPTKPKK